METNLRMSKIRLSGGLDRWLEERGITHPVILPVIRNQILLTLCIFFVGSAAGPESLWGMWFGAGFTVMTYILYSWAHFFLKAPLGNYSVAFLRAVLFHFLLRLVVLAFGLFAAVVWGKAPPVALLAGVAAGTFSPLLTLAWKKFTKNESR